MGNFDFKKAMELLSKKEKKSYQYSFRLERYFYYLTFTGRAYRYDYQTNTTKRISSNEIESKRAERYNY